MSIGFKPPLFKPFNSLTPLPASHLDHMFLSSQQQNGASSWAPHQGQGASLPSSSISSSPGPKKASQQGAQEELELLSEAFPLMPPPRHTSRRAVCSDTHLLSPEEQAHIPQGLCKASKAPDTTVPEGALLSDRQETVCHEATPTSTCRFRPWNKSAGISMLSLLYLGGKFPPFHLSLPYSHTKSLHAGPPQHQDQRKCLLLAKQPWKP